MNHPHISVSTKRQVLLWTDQWFPFCAAATISWRQWVLLLSSKTLENGNIGNILFLLTVIISCVVVALFARKKDEQNTIPELFVTFFNDPHVVAFFLIFALLNWGIGLFLLFDGDAPIWLAYFETISAGIACAGFFVMWAEIFVHVEMSQATFTLAACVLLSGLIDQITGGANEIAFFIMGLLLIAATAAGIQRAGAMLIGPSLMQSTGKQQPTHHESSVAGLAITVFLLLTLLSAIKTVGTGLPVMEFSVGVSLSGAIIVVLMLFFGRVPLNWLWRISLPLLLLGAASALFKGSISDIAGRIICDIPVGMLAIMAASIGVHYARTHATPTIKLACIAGGAFAAADLLGFDGTVALLQYVHISGTVIVLVATVVATIAVMVCLVWNDTLSLQASTFTGFSAFSAGEGLSYLRPISVAAHKIAGHGSSESESAKPESETEQEARSSRSRGAQHAGTMNSKESPFGTGNISAAESPRDVLNSMALNNSLSGEVVPTPGAPFCPLPSTIENAKILSSAAASVYGLRNRETEVLTQLLMGESAGQIAVDLFIARGTVKAHIHNIYSKMGIHNREELRVAVDKAYTKVSSDQAHERARTALDKADKLQQQNQNREK